MKKILVIDDDAVIRALLKESLTNNSFEVYTEEDGHSGFNSIIKHEPDVVLLDIYMGEHDGFGLLNKIRETPKKPFIITMSSREEWGKSSLLLGANCFLQKPLKIPTLIDTINHICN